VETRLIENWLRCLGFFGLFFVTVKSAAQVLNDLHQVGGIALVRCLFGEGTPGWGCSRVVFVWGHDLGACWWKPCVKSKRLASKVEAPTYAATADDGSSLEMCVSP